MSGGSNTGSSIGADPDANNSGNGASSQSASSGSNSQRSIVIQRNQANQLLVALKNELALAKAAENDKVKAQQHYSKAENIKGILLQYQAQQKAKQGNGNNSNNGSTSQSANSSSVSSPISTTLAQLPSISRPPSVNNNGNSNINISSAPSPIPTSPSPGNLTPNSNAVTYEKYTQINNRLVEIGTRIKSLEESCKTEKDQSQISNYNQELSNLRPKYIQYDKICTYMKKQLTPQPNTSCTPSPAVTPGSDINVEKQITPPLIQNKPQISTSTQIQSAQSNSSINSLGQSNSAPIMSNNPKLPQTQIPARTQSNLNINANNLNTSFDSNKFSNSSLPQSTSSSINYSRPLPNMVNSYSTTPTLRGPITSGKAIPSSRPMIPSGYGYTSTPGMTTNSMSRMPYDYLNSNTNYSSAPSIPDSGGRVLLKRKLAEVANNIGADEGDTRTILEGDVEDLLLDLADEFVTSITSFACKLAKHRKSDFIDTRDVQVHLERNWNIRVPGQALDEIKAVKKWQPSSEYNKKLDRIRDSSKQSDK